MAKKKQVMVDVLEFHPYLTNEQRDTELENLAITNEARRSVPGGGFIAENQARITVAGQWQSDVTRPKTVRDLATKFQQLAAKSTTHAIEQNSIDAMAFGFNLGVEWERLRFQTSSMAESVYEHRKNVKRMVGGRRKRHPKIPQSIKVKVEGFMTGLIRSDVPKPAVLARAREHFPSVPRTTLDKEFYRPAKLTIAKERAKRLAKALAG